MPRRRKEDAPPRFQKPKCKICAHPAKDEIDLMLFKSPYSLIMQRINSAYPDQTPIHKNNLSRHKKEHLMKQPIEVEIPDAETGQMVKAVYSGHLQRLEVPKEQLPEDTVTLPSALSVIINAGVMNIMQNPDIVTPNVLLMAIVEMRKMGLGGKTTDEFAAAWEKLGQEKEKGRKRVARRTTTVEEIEEDIKEDDPQIIDVSPLPTGWPDEELLLLGVPTDGKETN